MGLTRKKVEELLALEAKATESPWLDEHFTYCDDGGQNQTPLEDRRLICSMRSALRPLTEHWLSMHPVCGEYGGSGQCYGLKGEVCKCPACNGIGYHDRAAEMERISALALNLCERLRGEFTPGELSGYIVSPLEALESALKEGK